jgi:hypothetical protein
VNSHNQLVVERPNIHNQLVVEQENIHNQLVVEQANRLYKDNYYTLQ